MQTTELPRPRLQLSLTQVLASALAAVTATVAASSLGVAGTVIGAGVASVLTVTGNAVYAHSLQRIKRQPAAPPEPAPVERRSWGAFAAACAGVFAGVLVVITGFELVAGRPVSDVVQGKTGSGTTVLGDTGRSASRNTPTPTPVTITVTPSVVTQTPTVTVTGDPVTKTATPTETTTPSASPTTGTPTPTTSVPASQPPLTN